LQIHNFQVPDVRVEDSYIVIEYIVAE